MNQKPFKALDGPRVVASVGLPNELLEFYSQHEGIGPDSSSESILRFCRLSEIRKVHCRDLGIFAGGHDEAWGAFEGILIGIGAFLDQIVYVLSAPVCPSGSIMVFGTDIPGPGGDGDEVREPSLVLAHSFRTWLDHLSRWDWEEYGIVPGEIHELPANDQAQIRGYYSALNPNIGWGQ